MFTPRPRKARPARYPERLAPVDVSGCLRPHRVPRVCRGSGWQVTLSPDRSAVPPSEGDDRRLPETMGSPGKRLSLWLVNSLSGFVSSEAFECDSADAYRAESSRIRK